MKKEKKNKKKKLKINYQKIIIWIILITMIGSTFIAILSPLFA